MRTLIVSKKYDSKKLANFILDSFPELSINVFNKALRKKDIRINGIRVKENVVLSENDEISIYISDEFLFKKINLEIVFEDDNVLIVNKPIGIEVVSNGSGKSLTSILKEKYDFIEPCHRLDRNTSGLIMIAKNNKAHTFLTEQIKTKAAKRKYLAIVHGNFEQNTGIINAPISRHPLKPEKMAVVENGKPSVTHYKVLEQFKGYSFIELELETGRTHQIRVHMSYIGHPIVNDTLYNKIPFKVKTTEQVLQSYSLRFATLNNDDIISLEINPDNDIEKVLKYLRSNKK